MVFVFLRVVLRPFEMRRWRGLGWCGLMEGGVCVEFLEGMEGWMLGWVGVAAWIVTGRRGCVVEYVLGGGGVDLVGFG